MAELGLTLTRQALQEVGQLLVRLLRGLQLLGQLCLFGQLRRHLRLQLGESLGQVGLLRLIQVRVALQLRLELDDGVAIEVNVVADHVRRGTDGALERLHLREDEVDHAVLVLKLLIEVVEQGLVGEGGNCGPARRKLIDSVLLEGGRHVTIVIQLRRLNGNLSWLQFGDGAADRRQLRRGLDRSNFLLRLIQIQPLANYRPSCRQAALEISLVETIVKRIGAVSLLLLSGEGKFLISLCRTATAFLLSAAIEHILIDQVSHPVTLLEREPAALELSQTNDMV